jgi:hypothetical protein
MIKNIRINMSMDLFLEYINLLWEVDDGIKDILLNLVYEYHKGYWVDLVIKDISIIKKDNMEILEFCVGKDMSLLNFDTKFSVNELISDRKKHLKDYIATKLFSNYVIWHENYIQGTDIDD